MSFEDLQDHIDGLLAQACPEWPPPPRVGTEDEGSDQQRYERIEVTRLRLGRALAERPDVAGRLAEKIFETVLLERTATDQLIAPLITAIGRRPVLEQLIEAAGEGPCARRANAAAAAYWVRCWEHPQRRFLLRAAYDNGARSAKDLQDHLQQHLDPPRDIGWIDDLWPRFWQVSLNTFVECTDREIRQNLQTAFPLEAGCYPAEMAPLLAQAALLVEDDPERFERLHQRTTGYGHAI
jgi:hypothetical protein